MLHLQYILVKPNQWYITNRQRSVNPSSTAQTLASFLTWYRRINHYIHYSVCLLTAFWRQIVKYHIRKDQWSPRFLGQCVSEILCLWLSKPFAKCIQLVGSTGCMGVGLTYGSKRLIEIDRNSTPVQPMHELAYFKNVYIINLRKV